MCFSFCDVKHTDTAGSILLLCARVVFPRLIPRGRPGIAQDSVSTSITGLDAALCFYACLR